MLPVQTYHAMGYPLPDRRWPRFGDPVLEAALGGADGIRRALQDKRDVMQPFHSRRLEEDGLTPMSAHYGRSWLLSDPPLPPQPTPDNPEIPEGLPKPKPPQPPPEGKASIPVPVPGRAPPIPAGGKAPLFL